ncbi:MAG: methionyl-tRNA formyltransferase [Kofleriaceae bacterium]
MRVAFMGSPDFAVPCLRALVDANHEVALVVSQPDKPAGRGKEMHAPAVKTAAVALGLPVIQPKSARNGELEQAIRAANVELCVVVAYGKILPKAVLEAAPRGCINVHGSILPKYRGAAPVQRSVIDAEEETGVSIMQLDEGMDTGPVFSIVKTAIHADETAGELMVRLAPIGAAALIDVLAQIAAGTAVAQAQDAAQATHAAMLDKADGAIDFTVEASLVASRIRGVDPWPGAQAMLRGQPIKLFRAHLTDGTAARGPGTVVNIDKEGVHVTCHGGVIAIKELQAAGRKRMSAHDFAAGRGIAIGDKFEKVDIAPTPPKGAPKPSTP